MAYIYQVINKVNDKIYVGKTEHSIEKRFKEHCRDAFKERNEKRPLYAAMRKYGIENFYIELIEETDNPEEREIYWIEKKQSFKYGYNATMGGDGKRYIDYDLVVAEYSEIQNITKTAKKLNISVDTVKVALNSKKIKIKSSAEIAKEENSKVIKMFDMDLNYLRSFPSLRDAARYLFENGYATSKDLSGITSHIRKCANLQRKSAYKHIWKWDNCEI